MPRTTSTTRSCASREWETAAHDPRLLWPDTMAVAADGRLHVTANRLRHQAKYQRGEDLWRKPRTLFRIRLGVRPVPPR
jgi:hypothetical protein